MAVPPSPVSDSHCPHRRAGVTSRHADAAPVADAGHHRRTDHWSTRGREPASRCNDRSSAGSAVARSRDDRARRCLPAGAAEGQRLQRNGAAGTERRREVQEGLRVGERGMGNPQRRQHEVPRRLDYEAVHVDGGNAAAGAGQAQGAGRHLRSPLTLSRHVEGGDRPSPPHPYLGHPELHRPSGLSEDLHPSENDGRDDRALSRSAAGVRTGERIQVQQLRLLPARRDHREGHGPEVRGRAARPDIHAGRDVRHRLRPEQRRPAATRRRIRPERTGYRQRALPGYGSALLCRFALLDSRGPVEVGSGSVR